MVFADPMMDAEMAMIESCRADRSAAQAERRSAQSERDAHFERAMQEEGAAATARLVSGIIGGATKIAEGGMSIGAAARSHEARSHELDGESLSNRAIAAQNGADSPGVSAEHRSSLNNTANGFRIDANDARTAGLAPTRTAAQLQGVSSVVSGVGSVTTAALDFVASQHGIAAKASQQKADQARDRAEAAHELAQESHEVAGRMLGRMEETARAQRQAEDARIANIRG
jgi:hypothetical protein